MLDGDNFYGKNINWGGSRKDWWRMGRRLVVNIANDVVREGFWEFDIWVKFGGDKRLSNLDLGGKCFW